MDAYPNRPFEGTVLKIEPQSTVSQNVTMFAVLIRIPNEQGCLRPGMNADVEVHVGNRTNVLAIPNAALRTARDVGSAAQVLGLDPKDVDAILARADSQARQNPQTAGGPPGRSRGRPAGAGGAPSQRTEARRTAVAPPAVPAAAAAAGREPRGATGARTGGTPGIGRRRRPAAPGQGGFQRPPLPAGVTEEQWTPSARSA